MDNKVYSKIPSKVLCFRFQPRLTRHIFIKGCDILILKINPRMWREDYLIYCYRWYIIRTGRHIWYIACADWLFRRSMTDAYVTQERSCLNLPPKCMAFGGHFEFWATNCPRWPPKKWQDDLFTSWHNKLQEKHVGKKNAIT